MNIGCTCLNDLYVLLTAPVNKFKDSSMSHLLVKDKLMQDRKEMETQKKELTTKRGDLRYT